MYHCIVDIQLISHHHQFTIYRFLRAKRRRTTVNVRVFVCKHIYKFLIDWIIYSILITSSIAVSQSVSQSVTILIKQQKQQQQQRLMYIVVSRVSRLLCTESKLLLR